MNNLDSLDLHRAIHAILVAEDWPANALPVKFVFHARDYFDGAVMASWRAEIESEGPSSVLGSENSVGLTISSGIIARAADYPRIGVRLGNCCQKAAEIGMRCIRAKLERQHMTAHQILKAEAEASRWDDQPSADAEP